MTQHGFLKNEHQSWQQSELELIIEYPATFGSFHAHSLFFRNKCAVKSRTIIAEYSVVTPKVRKFRYGLIFVIFVSH